MHFRGSGSPYSVGAPKGYGDLGRMAIYFQGSECTGNYFRGAWEQAHSLRDLGSPAKNNKDKGKTSNLFDFLKNSSASGGIPPDPLLNYKCINFHITCTSEKKIGVKHMAIMYCC